MLTPHGDRGKLPARIPTHGIDWRGIVTLWIGPAITVGVLLLFIFGVGRHGR